jgi:hypothetical protein
VEKFAAFLDALLAQRSAELEFIVLFGSMARGDWSRGSDYDVLIGPLRRGRQTPARPAWQSLCRRVGSPSTCSLQPVRVAADVPTYHPLLLEALEHGVLLWDRGAFAEMRATFRQWRQRGQVQPVAVRLEDHRTRAIHSKLKDEHALACLRVWGLVPARASVSSWFMVTVLAFTGSLPS